MLTQVFGLIVNIVRNRRWPRRIWRWATSFPKKLDIEVSFLTSRYSLNYIIYLIIEGVVIISIQYILSDIRANLPKKIVIFELLFDLNGLQHGTNYIRKKFMNIKWAIKWVFSNRVLVRFIVYVCECMLICLACIILKMRIFVYILAI